MSKLKNFYLKNRDKLPKTIDGYINKFFFKINRRPYIGAKPSSKSFGIVEISPFKYDRRAAFCISADFELSWAWRFSSPKQAYNKGIEARNNFPLLLALLEKYSIPITWAIVGHLFLEKCDRGINGMPHQNMPRPTGYYENKYWKFTSGDWYQHDPCTCVEIDPLWYAPDLICEIIKSNLEHELAIHSFSHIDFSDKSCSIELARREIEECIKVMKVYDITPSSIVFPGSFEGHFNILSELGIIAYRGPKAKIELSYPLRKKEGIWNIHSSISLRKGHGYDFFERVKIFIKKAMENHLVFHIYFHPSDDSEIISITFTKILEYANKERSYGNLWIATMKEIGRYCEARKTTSIHPNIDGKTINIKLNTKLNHTKYGNPEITLKINIGNIHNNKTPEFIEYDGKNLILGTENCYIKKSKDNKYLVITLPVNTKFLTIKLYEK